MTGPLSRYRRLLPGLIVPLVFCVACGPETPPAPAPPAALPEMPADHPPMTATAVPAPVPPDTVLARAAGVTVTVAEVDAALARAPGDVRYEYTSPAAVTELVQSLVDRKLMAAAARQAGLLQAPEAQKRPSAGQAAGSSADAALADAWLARELAKLPSPGEAEVARYYREHQDDFTEPQRVFVTRAVAGSARAAEVLRRELEQGATPAALRERYAAELRGVDQLWLQETPGAPELTAIAIALALGPGNVSRVVPVGDGSVVLRVEQKQPRRLRPLEEVRAGILATLGEHSRQSATDATLRSLRKKVQVTLDDGAIDSYSSRFRVSVPEPVPAAQ